MINAIKVDYRSTPVLQDIEHLGEVSAILQKQVAEAMARRMRAMERAIFDAAFDAGLDLRQPWDEDFIRFARHAYTVMNPPVRLDSVVSVYGS